MKIDKSFDKIYARIDKARKKRTIHPENGIDIAAELYKKAVKHYFVLEGELPDDSSQLHDVAEALSTEMLEGIIAGIEQSEWEPSEGKAMREYLLELMSYAREIAPDGSDIAERLDRGIEVTERQLAERD